MGFWNSWARADALSGTASPCPRVSKHPPSFRGVSGFVSYFAFSANQFKLIEKVLFSLRPTQMKIPPL